MDAIKELKEYDGYILSEQYKIRHRVIQEIKQLRLANSDLQMNYDYARSCYDYARTERDKLQTEVLKLREELKELRLSYEVVVDALREKE